MFHNWVRNNHVYTFYHSINIIKHRLMIYLVLTTHFSKICQHIICFLFIYSFIHSFKYKLNAFYELFYKHQK